MATNVTATSGDALDNQRESELNKDKVEEMDVNTNSNQLSGTSSSSGNSCDGPETMDSNSNTSSSGTAAADLTPMPIVVKWSGKEYSIDNVLVFKTVGDLKLHIFDKTGVQTSRQKLLNLMHMGKPAADSCLLTNLKLKSGFKVMMMGSLEKDIETVDIPPEDRPEILNDLEFNTMDQIELIESNEVYLGKVERRIQEYNFKILNPLRPNKKLLVLDIDYTLFDHRSAAESGVELMRPFLHEFLRDAYKDYDIVIWSATSMKWIEEKMKLLNVVNHPDYKIAFYLDYLAMITVHTQKYGVVEVKPLGVIWGKYPQFSQKNTIMFDDLRRNFLMNPQSGLRIKPFRQAHLNRDTDCELQHLSLYLQRIARLDDFSTLDHQSWESQIKHRRPRSRRVPRHE